MSKIIYSIYYNGEFFQCVGNDVSPFFKRGNYYLITNRGSRLNPLITYHSSDNVNEEKVIGGSCALVDFMLDAPEDKTFILRYFPRVDALRFLASVDNMKKQQKLNAQRMTVQKQIGDKEYRMKDFYDIDNLMVARFICRSGVSNIFGFNTESTEQKYIFEVIDNGEKKSYREIFTGFIVDDSIHNDLPYIIDIHSFIDYNLSMEDRKISKLGLIWAQNDINFNKRKRTRKLKVKK